MAGIENKNYSPTVQDTANSYGCSSGVNPEGRKYKYHIKSKINPKKTKKEKIADAMKMVKLMGISIIKVKLHATK